MKWSWRKKTSFGRDLVNLQLWEKSIDHTLSADDLRNIASVMHGRFVRKMLRAAGGKNNSF